MQIRNNNIKNELVSAALIAAACEPTFTTPEQIIP